MAEAWRKHKRLKKSLQPSTYKDLKAQLQLTRSIKLINYARWPQNNPNLFKWVNITSAPQWYAGGYRIHFDGIVKSTNQFDRLNKHQPVKWMCMLTRWKGCSLCPQTRSSYSLGEESVGFTMAWLLIQCWKNTQTQSPKHNGKKKNYVAYIWKELEGYHTSISIRLYRKSNSNNIKYSYYINKP